jgi:hypothetical protein
MPSQAFSGCAGAERHRLHEATFASGPTEKKKLGQRELEHLCVLCVLCGEGFWGQPSNAGGAD